MTTLERVTQMQQQGYATADISRQLQQEGISPGEINDAINQLQVKTAVTGAAAAVSEPLPDIPPADPANPTGAPPIPPPLEPAPQQAAPQVQQPAQQSPPATPADYAQQTYSDQYAQGPASGEDYYPQTPQPYADQGYDQGYYAPSGAVDSETISEVAAQVVAEKFEEFQKETGDIRGFQESVQEKVRNLDERLKRIEDSIASLTQSVIGKIGEFGQSSALIHKDLDNLHSTVSKLMDPVIDHHKSHRSHAHHKKKK